MKKIYMAGAALCAIIALAACSGHKEKEAATAGDSDSQFVVQAEEKAEDVVYPKLTPDSLGPVKVGAKIASLPQGIPNLYDNIQVDEGDMAHVYSFYMGEEAMFDVYDFGEGKVDVISLTSPKLGVQAGDTLLTVGAPMELALKAGAKSDFQSLDDEGVWYWNLNGIWIYPSLNKSTQQLDNAMSNRRTPPSAALLQNVPVGYIATGLPF